MMIPYGRQTIEEDDIQAVVDVLRSDYLTTGPKIQEFEQTVADYTNTKYAVAVSNGTAALHAACFAAGIGEGDEVIVSSITFAASSNCVLYCGGTPVFADVCKDTYNIDPQDIERKITPKTKAIIPVHLAGQPCEMEAIHAIARKHHLLVIEDACHALGALYQGKKIGGLSDMTVFSFHPVKPVTTGEGGMIMTNDETLYKRLMLFRSHGITRQEEDMEEVHPGPWHYEQLALGYNYRITDIQCALGCSQMKKLDRFIDTRRRIAAVYDKAFAKDADIIIPHQLEGTESGWHLYIIQVAADRRRDIFEQLRQEGIGVNVHYMPVYMHPYYRNHGYANICCPVAEQCYGGFISLPIYPGLTREAQQEVIEKVRRVVTA